MSQVDRDGTRMVLLVRALRWPFAVAALISLVAMPGEAIAQVPCANPVALFESVKNSVQIVQASTAAPQPATRQVRVCPGDTIRVGDNSRAVIIILTSNTPLAIDQNSELIIPTPAEGPGSFINLLRGALLYISRVRRATGVNTPFVNASIEGTEFLVRVTTDRTEITVFEGAVRATNDAGNVLVGPGQRAVAIQKQAPQLEVVVSPRDAVQWALYYEPIMPADSFDALAQIPDANRDARYYVRSAALLLGAGQLAEARTDVAQALKLEPSNGDAYALQTVIAVALNDRDEALRSGRAAVDRAPQSASAQVALSYALQSAFQLQDARDAAVRAVTLDDSDGTAWARLSELRLMLDDVGGAAEAASRAITLSPQLARAHVVQGFVSLTRLKLGDAEAAFDRAIGLDSDNPLARLGLGLTKIRRGRLGAGRTDLEIAVALNPDSALVRSYLGKAYFDERRGLPASDQFAMAKRLDPMDPTPWFYDAIEDQTANQPVNALAGLERAITLNDSRAVYRSRFLLDQDLAARSASLGRIYRDLGFEQLALVEGWKSLEADASDHAGHRFLADTYSAVPRHSVARVSELLQAQLLQPVSLTPVSPRLAETDLFILDGSGPDAPAFNEFNPMFNRNRVAVQVSGAIGDEAIRGEEVTVSGVWNRLSFSAGQFHYGGDGLRINNDQDRDIYNVFVQASLSNATSVQAEFRAEDHQFGDLFVNFDPTDFVPEQTTEVDGTTTRFGVRHTFTPNSTLIASIYARNQDESFTESISQSGITANQFRSKLTDGWTAELRHLWRVNRFRLSSGIGRFQSERDLVATNEVGFPPFVFTTSDTFRNDQQQTNLYAYSYTDLTRRLTVTLGASADFYRSEFFDRDQINPKLGASWRATPSTTIRAAAFRTLHRAAVSTQTIEPTNVSGFNQLFADAEGVEAVRYGVALDQKFGERVFAGAEYSWRDLWVPVQFVNAGVRSVSRRERSEQAGRTYLYWTPHPRMSINAGYALENFDGDATASGFHNILRVRTHRVPLGVRYFAPSGLAAQLTAHYLDQAGRFSIHGLAEDGADRFWVVDSAVGYRLPKRYGRITLDIRNLLNAEFNFQDTDSSNPTVRRGRVAVLRFTFGI